MDRLIIRTETEDDHREVETLIREAFWNLNFPGCDEHFLAHILFKQLIDFSVAKKY